MSRFSIVVTLLIITACSSSREAPLHSFIVSEENGVTVAETTGGPKYLDPLFTYEELFQLEQDPSQEKSILSTASLCLMDEQHNIYISDSRNYRIAVFDSRGIYSHSIGREGDGPGEFRQPHLTSVRNGIVAVTDANLGRLSLFRTNGDFIESFRFQAVSMSQSRVPFQTLDAQKGPDDTIILNQQIFLGSIEAHGLVARAGVFSTEDELLVEILSPPPEINWSLF